VEKDDVVPVRLSVAPAQPAEYTQPPVVHAGHVAALPYVPASAPVAAHCAKFTSVHALAPVMDVEPAGHGY
jgi:hypothetical protein